jgi:hypothetical protein
MKCRTPIIGGLAVAAAAVVGALIATGAVTVDLNIGRSTRPLGPIRRRIEAPAPIVFDVVAAPYLGTTPRAMANKLRVLERGADMVLAAHFTPIGFGLRATTVETVRFEPPERASFRLARGPVPYVAETFELRETDGETELVYSGELGTDLWKLGSWWANRVATSWEQTVADSLDSIQAESERRACL